MKTKNNRVNILLFWFMNDWGKYGRAYEKIAENLSKLPEIGKVLCVFPPKKIDEGYHRLPFSFVRFSQKLVHLTPNNQIIYIPSDRFRFRKWLNIVIPDLSSKIFLWFLGFRKKNTLFWIFPPHNYLNRLLSIAPYHLLISHIIDDNSVREECSMEQITFFRRQYERLARISDIVITTSRVNYDLFRSINSDCYLFDIAVDSIFLGDQSKLPSTINKSRPQLGYVGFMSQRTDIKLLDYVARTRPQYDLILCGPQEENLNKYGTLQLPNVFYKGAIPYGEVPALLETMDVCLIPHKDTPYSRSMNPLKLLQYLAKGRPVVSTSIAGTEKWKYFIFIAHDYNDFVNKIDIALTEDTEELRAKRIAAVKSETWEKRVSDMFTVISNHLDTKK